MMRQVSDDKLGSPFAICHREGNYDLRKISCEAAMISSKLTSKARTTIQQAVRAALRLKEGDELVFIIEDDRAIITKAHSGAAEYPFATFGEWDGEADRRSYAKL
jgi:antitoxin PrlF